MEKYQNKTSKNLINWIEFYKGLIFSLLLLIVLIIGYAFQRSPKTIWIVQFVVQVGMASLWWIAKSGAFSMVGPRNISKIGKSIAHSRKNKLGGYKYDPNPTNENEQKNKSQPSKWRSNNLSGVVLMYLFALVQLIVYLVI